MIDESSAEAPDCRCRYCKQPVADCASVCHKCGKRQNRLLDWFQFDNFSVFISLVLVILAYLQFKEAREERIKAQTAVREATSARDTAQSVARRVQGLQEGLREHALSAASMSYLQLQASAANIVSMNNPELLKRTDKARDELYKEINTLIALAIPDEKERQQYSKTLMIRIDP